MNEVGGAAVGGKGEEKEGGTAEDRQTTLEDEGEQKRQQREAEQNQEGEQGEHPRTQNPQLSEHS